MVWQPEVEELARRRALAHAMGGAERVGRQHAQGKLTVRERIDGLVDAGTFHEIGELAGDGVYEDGELVGFTPRARVLGLAELDGRPVVVGGSDFTIRGGSGKGMGQNPGLSEDLASAYRLPRVELYDAAGANVEAIADQGAIYLPNSFNNWPRRFKQMQQAPCVSAVLGSVAGGPAGWAVAAHFSVMVKGTSAIFASGPPVVRRALGHEIDKEQLGGSQVHTRVSGLVDNEAASEEDAFVQIRRFLSYMPSNVWEAPPEVEPRPAPEGTEDLLSIVPRNRKRPYSMKRLIRLLVDGGEFFEIAPRYGASVITALTRVEGKAFGVVANNPNVYGGAMDATASRKLGRFLELCDYFHLPVLYLVDIPGFLIGEQAERAGTLRSGAGAIWSWATMTVPSFTIHIRKCYGMAGATTSNASRLSWRLAWPSGEFGSIPIEGGVDAAFRRQIAEADDPDAKRQELEDSMAKYRNPFLTAEAAGVEEIIDPRETRTHIARWLKLAYRVLPQELGPKPKYGVRP
ncbi:MAG: Acetyl-CoA carboxylase, carboxyltransferase component [Chloroflexi bacterium]|nr:MAG: Acetyl-CoA carboxylase, carboxyltransferase component [Chloroflexota bacterium]